MWRMDVGPAWRQFNEPEKQFCRKNYWTNLLFVNNYVASDEPVSSISCESICELHILCSAYSKDGIWLFSSNSSSLASLSWPQFIGELFIPVVQHSHFCSFISFKSSEKALTAMMCFMSLLIPAIITYRNNFYGVFIIQPE